MRENPEEGKTRRRVRLAVRCFALAAAVVFVLGVLPWSWTPMVLASLSPHVLIGSAIAARSISTATLVGLPVLLMVLVRRRWFCRYACPVGLMTESIERLRSSRKSGTKRLSHNRLATRGVAGVERSEPPAVQHPRQGLWTSSKRLPYLGRWIVLVTLGGACFGYPLFLWMDPLAIFTGVFSLWHQPLSLAGQVSAVALAVILGISLWMPGAWCRRICPLGATQELLALLQRRKGVRNLFLGGTQVHGEEPGPKKVPDTFLCRRSVLSIGLGALCVGLGARLGLGLSARFSGDAPKSLRPPGSAGRERFAGLCIRCGNCIRACPTGIIEPDLGRHGIAGFLAPVIRFQHGYCREDCHRCTQVCPSGAIRRLSLEEKQRTSMGVAEVDVSICLLSEDRECDICARACPYEAIDIVWSEKEYLAVPRVDREKCPGCGACEVVCPGTNEWERRHADGPIPARKAVEVHPCRFFSEGR